MKLNINLLVIGALLGALAVILGAFGAHGLKDILNENQLATFETAVRYQMYHGLAILVIPSLLTIASVRWLNRAALTFIVGSVLFSGSLYMLLWTGLKFWGPITPLGGTGLILGWLFVGVAIKVGKDSD